MADLGQPAFKKRERKLIIMDFRGFSGTKKIDCDGLKMFFFASKNSNIIIHF